MEYLNSQPFISSMFLLGWDAAKKQEPLEIQDEVWWAFAPPATKEIRHAMRISRYQIVSNCVVVGDRSH